MKRKAMRIKSLDSEALKSSTGAGVRCYGQIRCENACGYVTTDVSMVGKACPNCGGTVISGGGAASSYCSYEM